MNSREQARISVLMGFVACVIAACSGEVGDDFIFRSQDLGSGTAEDGTMLDDPHETALGPELWSHLACTDAELACVHRSDAYDEFVTCYGAARNAPNWGACETERAICSSILDEATRDCYDSISRICVPIIGEIEGNGQIPCHELEHFD